MREERNEGWFRKGWEQFPGHIIREAEVLKKRSPPTAGPQLLYGVLPPKQVVSPRKNISKRKGKEVPSFFIPSPFVTHGNAPRFTLSLGSYCHKGPGESPASGRSKKQLSYLLPWEIQRLICSHQLILSYVSYEPASHITLDGHWLILHCKPTLVGRQAHSVMRLIFLSRNSHRSPGIFLSRAENDDTPFHYFFGGVCALATGRSGILLPLWSISFLQYGERPEGSHSASIAIPPLKDRSLPRAVQLANTNSPHTDCANCGSSFNQKVDVHRTLPVKMGVEFLSAYRWFIEIQNRFICNGPRYPRLPELVALTRRPAEG